MIRTVFTIAGKEIRHIMRDPRSLVLIFLLPIIMMVLYGYAINMDIKHARIGILDHDKTWATRQVASHFDGSDFFAVYRYYSSSDEVTRGLESGDVKAVLIFPADFTSHLDHGTSPEMQVLIDGSDSNTGKIIQSGIRQILRSVTFGSGEAPLIFRLEPRVWYNPDMEGVNFIVPGLVAVFLMMIAALLTSITIAREKETGTMTQLQLSPATPGQIVTGKVLPYILLAFFVGALMLVFALIYYRVPFHGSPLLLAGLSLAYLWASLSIGLLASTIAKTQQVAMAAGLLATLLPSIILSGFIFPLRSMPVVLQWISTIIPAKYFLEILRAIMLRGVGFEYVWQPFAALIAFSVILMVVSTIRFRRQLER